MKPYTYLVLKYVHDRGANEALNIGVLIFAPEALFISVALEHRYERLSSAFAGFSGEHYRGALARVRLSVSELQKSWTNNPLFRTPPTRLAEALSQLWTDRDGGFRWSEPLGGVADDFETELGILFDRMVSSQYPHPDELSRRDDEHVWRHAQDKLPVRVVHALTSKRFSTAHIDVEFAHAIKNGAWHVVQPVSFDYKNADTMQKKATQWLGTTVGLQSANELHRIYFLLGRPAHKAHRKAYERAKALLDQSPVAHEMIEEEDAALLGQKLEAILVHNEDS